MPPHGRLTRQVYDALRREIDGGRYAAQTRLPPEREMCQQYGVSRVTLRRALDALRREQRVEARHGSGIYVCPPPNAASTSTMLAAMVNYAPSLLTRIQDEALVRGYLVSIFSQVRSEWNPAAERTFLQRVKDERFRALLAFCSPMVPRNDDLLSALAAGGTRVLHVEHYRTELPEEDYYLPDYATAGRLAAGRLLAAGYGPICIVWKGNEVRPQMPPFAKLLLKGIDEVLAGTPGAAPLRWVMAPSSPAEAASLAAELPSGAGVLALTAEQAGLLPAAFQAAGRDCPGDVGLAGIHLAGSFEESFPIDVLAFDGWTRFPELIGEIVSPLWPGVRELIEPVWHDRGTLRA